MEKLILVNKNDEILGTMEKMEVHRKGLLHRAVSVFLFNDMDEMLLQKERKQNIIHLVYGPTPVVVILDQTKM